MTNIRDFKDLVGWQRGMDSSEQVYKLTKGFPGTEQYGLTSQLRRASVSIPSNIAEGHRRKSRADYLRHLSIPLGSLGEVETRLLLARRIGYVDQKGVQPLLSLADKVGRLVHGLYGALNHK